MGRWSRRNRKLNRKPYIMHPNAHTCTHTHARTSTHTHTHNTTRTHAHTHTHTEHISQLKYEQVWGFFGGGVDYLVAVVGYKQMGL